jgi:hypothetical protein
LLLSTSYKHSKKKFFPLDSMLVAKQQFQPVIPTGRLVFLLQKQTEKVPGMIGPLSGHTGHVAPVPAAPGA